MLTSGHIRRSPVHANLVMYKYFEYLVNVLANVPQTVSRLMNAVKWNEQRVVTSAVVDKCFVDKLGDKTAILRRYDMSTKILFCRHNHVLFWKRKDRLHLKNNIDKISHQKGLTVAKTRCQASAAACLTLSPPLFTWPIPMIHRVTWSLDFGRTHHCIYFLTVVLSKIVDVGMKFDPTCRQRNLSSTTALVVTFSALTLTGKTFPFHDKAMLIPGSDFFFLFLKLPFDRSVLPTSPLLRMVAPCSSSSLTWPSSTTCTASAWGRSYDSSPRLCKAEW